MPVEVLRYGLVPDSGGPGEFRGGLAFIREFRFLSPTRFVLRGDADKAVSITGTNRRQRNPRMRHG